MNTVDLAGSYIALGDARSAACPDCGEQRGEQAVLALPDTGVIELGLMIGDGGLRACRCGVLWLCSLCPERILMDGSSPWQHVRASHARVTA